MNNLEALDKLITEAVGRKGPVIIEISSVQELYELCGMSAGAGGPSVAGHANNKRNKKVRKEVQTERMLRKYINQKIKAIFEQKNRKQFVEEYALRKVIRQILMEGDVSDVHPHRSTGINVLEDVLKKSIPTLRSDYKRLTTEKEQRESFRAHIIKAVTDQLKPSLVNDQYPLEAPTPNPMDKPSDEMKADVDAAAAGGDSPDFASDVAPVPDEGGDDDFMNDMAALEEAEIDIDIEGGESPPEKKLDVEDDDGLSDEEEFGQGLEGMDETGRNMAYTSFRKISQYILDAYDSLANMEDKNVFVDYLITNLKLYFDKFEDELMTMPEEPTTDQYQQAADSGT
jgi:hypothetical protein